MSAPFLPSAGPARGAAWAFAPESQAKLPGSADAGALSAVERGEGAQAGATGPEGFAAILLALLGLDAEPGTPGAEGTREGAGSNAAPGAEDGEAVTAAGVGGADTASAAPASTDLAPAGPRVAASWNPTLPADAPANAAASEKARPGTEGETLRTTRAGWVALAGEAPPATRSASAVGGRAAEVEAARGESRDDEMDAGSVKCAPDVDAVKGAPDVSATPGVISAAAAAAIPSHVRAVSADVRTPDRALEHLDPELRAKVERVVERMATEHGVRVSVAEGYRTPQRQRFLYAQGRTRPGSVVTWTKDSLHSSGRAADLRVEGPWDQPKAYAALQTVASEEGLSTLGMKDPGHVELKSAGGVAEAGASHDGPDALLPPDGDASALVERAPSAARPARVARVATAARVADVAKPARPGAAREERSASPETTRKAEGHDLGATRPEILRAEAFSAPRVSASEPAPASAVVRADPMAAVERVSEVRAAQAGSPVQRVSVRLEGAGTPVERVRVDLVDRALRGGVDVADDALAARLRGDAGTLLRTLEARGYESPTLTVGGTAAAATARGAAAELLGTALRGEGLPPSLQALLGDPAPAAGRGSQSTWSGEQGGREGRQAAYQQESRRENRREGR